MSVIPASRLSGSDLAELGNNLLPAVKDERRQMLGAVNRSLAVHAEELSRFIARPRHNRRPAEERRRPN